MSVTVRTTSCSFGGYITECESRFHQGINKKYSSGPNLAVFRSNSFYTILHSSTVSNPTGIGRSITCKNHSKFSI